MISKPPSIPFSAIGGATSQFSLDEPLPITPGNDYMYHERIALALGRGFSPNDPTEAKFPCINFLEEQLDPGPPKTEFSMIYVTNSSQLEFSVNVDTSVEARLLTSSGSFKSHYDASTLSSSSAITVVLTAFTNFGRWGLKASPTLTDRGKDLLKTPRDFEQTCGSHYVLIEQRGASVSAIVTLLSISDSFKAGFKAEMSGSGGWGPLSATATNMFQAELKHASTQDRLQVKVFATGGSGLGALSDVVKASLGKPNAIDTVTLALASFLSTFTKDNAAVTRYSTASMKDFGWDVLSVDPWTDLKERKLRDLARNYVVLSDDLDMANAFADGTHPIAKLEPDWVLWFKGKIPSASNYLSALAAQHQQCKTVGSPDKGCDAPPGAVTFEPISGLVKRFLEPPTVVMRSFDFTAEQSRVILNAPPEGRMQLANLFNPKATGFGATLYAKGPYNFTMKIDFVTDDGSDLWHVISEVPDGAWLWWESISASGQMLEDVLKESMAVWTGEHSGTFYLVVTDKMARVFRLGFLQASWKASGTRLEQYSYEIVF